jgi:hypothetical protein
MLSAFMLSVSLLRVNMQYIKVPLNQLRKVEYAKIVGETNML